jgi:hypothetical protein
MDELRGKSLAPIPEVETIAQVRSEYTSARLIVTNLDHRLSGTRFERQPGYLPAEIDYTSSGGKFHTIAVRDYDVRYLDRVAPAEALEHLNLIHRARHGSAEARRELERRAKETYEKISARFASTALIENENVIPYTTTGSYSEADISNKGSILLALHRHGFATADFSLLAAGAYSLPREAREKCVRETIRNLEVLSGRRLDDPANPLLIAMRSAVPEYIPGFMPTYLNVGLTPEMLPGLPKRYGAAAAARIRLNNRKTILEVLNPEAFRSIEKEIQPDRSIEANSRIASEIEAVIERHSPRLLVSALDQVLFFLSKAYDYYENHLDVLRNFQVREPHPPSIIFQRMVCSVIDRRSYAGVLYSRHPRLGTGVFLQFARTIYGEDLMTGRLQPEERYFQSREEAREEFPAVYHFWPRLAHLEEIFRAPVVVEFTGVHGTFTTLQVNPAEMPGAGMLLSVMGMHQAGRINTERVKDLIKPYHIRQVESDAIDQKSFHLLTPFCRGLAVLPRAAVTGRLYLSASQAQKAKQDRGGENVILAKKRFTPQDAIDMQKVSGICSLSPAAIHVVTAAQNLGIPALLNLEEDGVWIDEESRRLVSGEGRVIREGDWVTISSRRRTLYSGRATFAPARLLRFMAGEKLELTAADLSRFERLAACYREYKKILENAEASEFRSLQDIGHSIRYGRLQKDRQAAAAFVNKCFDVNEKDLVRRLLEATLGTHLVNLAAYELLTADRQIRLLKSVLAICRENGISGYQAGAFVIGSLVTPRAGRSFWESFEPHEVAMLANEWVLHQKYLNVMSAVGEREVSRMKDSILSRGLGPLRIHKGFVTEFMTLKLSRVDLGDVRRAVAGLFDPQTEDVLDMLRRPFGDFYDYENPQSLSQLQRICETEGVPLPRPEDV